MAGFGLWFPEKRATYYSDLPSAFQFQKMRWALSPTERASDAILWAWAPRVSSSGLNCHCLFALVPSRLLDMRLTQLLLFPLLSFLPSHPYPPLLLSHSGASQVVYDYCPSDPVSQRCPSSDQAAL